MSAVPSLRIRECNNAPVRPGGDYVLYWMIANRRLRYNFALDRALEYGKALGKPLVIFEALRAGYRWASDRIHRFVMAGMEDNSRACEEYGVCYLAYVEPAPGEGKGLLRALASNSCVVVSDEFPCFFLPRMISSAAKQLPVLIEAVDSNGLLPIRATDRVFQRAFDFRRFLQKELPGHLNHFPATEPLSRAEGAAGARIDKQTLERWPMASAELLRGSASALAKLPIDHTVEPVEIRGGSTAARKRMEKFFRDGFKRYGQHRSEPEAGASSGFSSYLHFGHLSVHEIFDRLAKREAWKLPKLWLRGAGSKEGWWNMSATAESFLDELITWRELGYNFTSHRTDYDEYESLSDWARKTLSQHARDKREHVYSLGELESAKTHDALWNAAQSQLLTEGRIHNYLRMLWGKKILEWSRKPEEAAEVMIHLNNKYGIDGRNPNSYSGIFWVFGRYDRPWAPERPVFGKIRSMSSEQTARKFRVKGYIEKYNANARTQRRLAR